MDDASPDKLETLGLWGDGDELGALRDVERRFDVKLDYVGAGSWFTVGDVYADLLKVLPQPAVQSPDTWPAFAEAIAEETGVDPLRIAPETRLIDRSSSPWVSLALLAVGVAIGCVIVFWPF